MKKGLLITLTALVLSTAAYAGMFDFFGGKKEKKEKKKTEMLQLKGSDTILNLGQKVAESIMGEDKSMRIAVTGGGSGTGIAAILNGTVDVAQASRKIKDKELKAGAEKGMNIVEHVIAYDGITVVVNKNNPLNGLTQEQIRAIFVGDISNWKEVGGNDETIVVLSRDNSSGTHAFFKEHVLRRGNEKGPEEYREDSIFLPSNEAIVGEVQRNTGAMGYIGMGYADDRTKGLPVNGVSATVANVANKTYPISRGLYWYTNGQGEGAVKTLLDYMMSEKGQALVAEEGFVPVK